MYLAEENLSTDIDIDDDDDDDAEYAINSAIVDEKEIAADVIGEIFENTRSNFLPYVETSISELVKLASHHSGGVRRSVASSLFSFLTTFYSMSNPAQWEAGLPVVWFTFHLSVDFFFIIRLYSFTKKLFYILESTCSRKRAKYDKNCNVDNISNSGR